jgi:phosphate-selective porin OprO/OprP
MSFRSIVLTAVAISAAAAPAVLAGQQVDRTPGPQVSVQAAAQATAQQAAAQAPAAAPPRVVAGQDGIAIESGNGDFRLQIGLLLHADGRFALDDDNGEVVDTFAARRVRPYLRGRLSRRFEFYLNPDFAGSTLAVQDAYIDTIFAPQFRLRAGKTKTPFGMERLFSVSNILFLERAFPNVLVPNRDVGVQVLGDISGGVVSYLAGVSNGVADGASGDADTTDSKDMSGRFVVRPFAKMTESSPVRGLGLAISGNRGNQSGAAALPTYRTVILQQPFFSYATGAMPAVADGHRSRYSPQIWYVHRSFAGWVEHVHTQTEIRRGADLGDVGVDAWQVAGSWVITRENATDTGGGIRPRNNFNFGNGAWGAFQVAARYHELTVDEEAFDLNLAAAGASRTAESWTVGLNWYLTGNLRYIVNFERTVFDGNADGPRRAENALAFRTQINF